MRLIIHPDASTDIEDQAAYYARIEPTLAQAFLDEISSSIETIRRLPRAFPLRRSAYRMYVMPRFPFSILYRVADDHLQILVIRHHAQHEDYGLGRL